MELRGAVKLSSLRNFPILRPDNSRNGSPLRGRIPSNNILLINSSALNLLIVDKSLSGTREARRLSTTGRRYFDFWTRVLLVSPRKGLVTLLDVASRDLSVLEVRWRRVVVLNY